jgi:hypothetical protein
LLNAMCFLDAPSMTSGDQFKPQGIPRAVHGDLASQVVVASD